MNAGSAAPELSLRAQIDEFVRDLANTFANILFAVSLFAVWGVLTLIGVIVDQNKDPSFYTANYAPVLARVVLRLHLDNMYHSPPYIGIIALILISLGVCTFKRVIPARLPPLRAVKIEHIPLNATLEVRGEERDVRERIARFFSDRGWQVRKRELGGVEWTFADKHNWARRGVLVAHAGFVIIAAGTTLYWWKGFSGTSAVLTGNTVTIPQTGTRVTLDRFHYRFDPIKTKSGIVYQPIDYVSNVRIVGRDGRERATTVRVNHPIDVGGTLYYQASFGHALNLTLTREGKAIRGVSTAPLMEGDAVPIPGTPETIQYERYVGTIDRKTGQPGPDPRANNPGVVLNFYEGDRLAGASLVRLGQSIDLGSGYRVRAAGSILYSGFEYRHDPGIPLVAIGAFVLLSGLCIAFYFLPARLYVRVDGEAPSWHVGIAATTVKGYDIFEEQFRALVEALERSERPPATAPVPQGQRAPSPIPG
ncbi:MAG: cytochrome c biogenesis protein ResB [Candidatus Baltobacteraceae bacterium]